MSTSSIKAEIVAFGSELVSGATLDTNSRWLSEQLAEIGIDVRFHTVGHDHLEENVLVLRQAVQRSRLVLITGGLGPTQDDLTRHALAALAGTDLVLDAASLEHVTGFFRRLGRPMPQRNRIQAMFPAGSRPIPNAQGTAPGIWLDLAGPAGPVTLVALPGVPREMVHMFQHEVRPRLEAALGGGRVIRRRQINCIGAGESTVDELLGELTDRGRQPEVGLTVHDSIITVRITAQAGSAEEADQQIEQTAHLVCQRLGRLVFSQGPVSLEEAVGRLLLERGVTIGLAESCTGGLVGHRLTEVSGISASLRGGVIAYSNEAKRDLLGVPEALMASRGAVSPEVAVAMAQGARQRFGADLGLGLTGIAGPTGATADKPVGLVYIALAHAGGAAAERYQFLGDRSGVKDRAAKAALNRIRLYLLEADPAGRA